MAEVKPQKNSTKVRGPSRFKDEGFTLLEVLVILGIIAILAATAVPSMKRLISSSAVSSNVNDFMAAINFTRAEAIRRGLPVVMCASSDSEKSSTPSCSNSSNWENGWIVFLDADDDGVLDSSKGDQIVRVQGELTKTGSIKGASGTSGDSAIEFLSNGMAKMTSPANFQFLDLSADTSLAKTVCLNFGGRARIATGTSCSTSGG